jgi:acetate kinase
MNAFAITRRGSIAETAAAKIRISSARIREPPPVLKPWSVIANIIAHRGMRFADGPPSHGRRLSITLNRKALSMRILVFNCGSSSLKFELIEMDNSAAEPRRLARGEVEEIGPQAKFTMSQAGGSKTEEASPVKDHAAAAGRVLDAMKLSDRDSHIDATAHRIVHGGEEVNEPVIADAGVMRALEAASRFAPLHNPPALATLNAVARRLRGVPSVVVTDTGFHRTLPPHARTYAIPKEVAARHGIRRFGFHGIGHAWMLERYAQISGSAPDKLNLITLQLGAGCSAAAILAGRSVDTSMGLTPLEGLMMATRSGDIDPAIFSYLASSERLAPDAVERMLNHDSGLRGVSGLSNDMRELEAAAARGDADSALAIEMFCYRARKYIGAYMAVLGRTDAIVFGGGIGEHAEAMRARICAGMERLGIALDADANRAANGREARFSAGDSAVRLWVVPLDEELYIARAAARLFGEPK